MKKYLHLAFLLGALSAQAQNLVPNPSFEDYEDCPSSFTELPFPSGVPTSITAWSRPSEATSDYFNTCATGSSAFLSIPENFAGTQMPRTGNSYTGGYSYLAATQFSDYREYIQAQLSAPLIAGHRYHVSYWVSLAEWLNEGWALPVAAVDQMGAYFCEIPEERLGVTDVLDDLVPQVASPVGSMLVDTAGWTIISGIFTATGNEKWVILGNFTPLSSLNVEAVLGSASQAYSYYYFDDVCVMDIDGPPGVYHVHDTSLCYGTDLILSGSDNASGYLWDNGSTDKYRAVTDSGLYWVKSTDPGNCSIIADTFKVGAIKTLPVNLGNDTLICNNTSMILDAYDETFKEYYWNTGSTLPAIEISSPGKYYVSIFSECFTGSDTIEVTLAPLPKALLPQDMILCEGTPVPLSNDQSNVTNLWSTGEEGCCIEIDKAGIYKLTASNICGDKATDEIRITYSGCNNCILTPTAFSPNGDGLNDQYTVINNCLLESYVLKIFNRWGQLVFESHAIDESWDGNINGIPAEVGAYFYYLKAVPVINSVEKTEKRGDITLLR